MQLNTTLLITPRELLEEFPLDIDTKRFIQNSRDVIGNILSGKDKRFLLIVGPCSIHDSKSAIEYAARLKELSDRVSSHLVLVMRTYVEKPRTALGWKGLLHDPHLDGSHDVNTGLMQARKLLLEISKMGVPCAMEFLELMSANYLSDLISWGCIGARTAASQPHRQLASYLSMPVGFKNGVDGNLNLAIQGSLVAKHSHAFIGINQEGKVSQLHSQGNIHSHVVLRGGGGRTNYDATSVTLAEALLSEFQATEKFLIDCSHGNSSKNYLMQKDVFHAIIAQASFNSNIVGAMLESHLNEGSQAHAPLSMLQYAVSLTDPCINWETTEELILHAFEALQQNAYA